MTTTSAAGRGADHGRLHVGRRLDPHHVDRPASATASGEVVTRVTRRPAPGGRLGQGVALLARRPVGEEAHRVDRLAGPPGAHHHPHAAVEVAGPGPAPSARGPRATMVAGSASRPGPDVARRPGGPPRASTTAPRAGAGVARLSCDRRVLPHLGVHGRADQHRGPGGQQRGGEQVVGQAGGVASRAGGRWPGPPRPGRPPGRGAVWGMGEPRPTGCAGPARRPAPRRSPRRRTAVASSVSTGATWTPASTRRRQTSTAL